MKRVTTLVLAMMLTANVASAGPLRDAVARAGQTTRPARAASGENKMLWPGLALVGAGTLLALYGFTHATGAEIGSNQAGTSVSISEKHATGVGFAGLAVAGVGGALLMIGSKQSQPNRKVIVSLNSVTVRF